MSSQPWQWSPEHRRYYRWEIRNGRNECIWDESGSSFMHSPTGSNQSANITPLQQLSPGQDASDQRRTRRDAIYGLPPSISLADPEEVRHHPVLPEHGWYENLDHNYRVRTNAEEYSFFQRGRVFSMLWSEPAGESSHTLYTASDNSRYTTHPNSAIIEGRFGQKVFSGIRRFVVMRVNRQQHFVEACSISTYGHRGCLRPGCNPTEHTIVFSRGYQPQYVPGEYERGMTKNPIAVEPAEPGEYISGTSRLRFGKPYTIACNVKVRDLGMVIPEHIKILYQYYQDERDSGFELDEYEDEEPGDLDHLQKLASHSPRASIHTNPSHTTHDRVKDDHTPASASKVVDTKAINNARPVPESVHGHSGYDSQKISKDAPTQDTAGTTGETSPVIHPPDDYSNVARRQDIDTQDPEAHLPPGDIQTDSGYASNTLAKVDQSSVTAGLELDGIISDAGLVGDDVQSVISDNSDVKSTTSYQTTWREKEGKDYIAQMLVLNNVLHPLCQEALRSMGRTRFIRNVRRTLKGYYRNLLQDAHTERERVCVGLLRSRRGRQRISQIMADVVGAVDNQEDEPQERLIQYRKDPETINAWIKVLSSTDYLDPGTIPLLSEAQPPNALDDGYLSESSDSGEDDVIKFPHLEGMTRFFCESRSFRVLSNEFRMLALPSEIRDILLTIPKDRIWISTERDDTLLNRVKSSIEDYTQLRWDWWPLQHRLRRLGSNEARLFSRCFCGTLLWTEIDTSTARLLLDRLPEIDTEGQRLPRCRLQKTWTQWLGDLRIFIRTVAPSRSSQRYTPPSGTPVSPPSDQSSQQGPSNQPTASRQQQPTCQKGTPTATPHSTAISTQLFDLPKHWVLLGVKGPRPSLEISHIPIHQDTNDSSFYRSLRQEYRRSRGRIRLWLSFWKLGYCEVIKFKRIAPQWIIRDRKELPVQAEYVYQPRPPTAENPPISQHEFEMHLNACTKPCRWPSPFHYCMPELNTTSAIQRIPKKDEIHAFGTPSSDDKYTYAWGLEATHVISALHVLIYHILIFVVPFGFWGWWISRHPDDLQGAAVPATFVLGLLSLFWSMNGILTEGRHGSKSA